MSKKSSSEGQHNLFSILWVGKTFGCMILLINPATSFPYIKGFTTVTLLIGYYVQKSCCKGQHNLFSILCILDNQVYNCNCNDTSIYSIGASVDVIFLCLLNPKQKTVSNWVGSMLMLQCTYPIVLPLLDLFGAPLLHVVDFSPPSLDCYLNQSQTEYVHKDYTQLWWHANKRYQS